MPSKTRHAKCEVYGDHYEHTVAFWHFTEDRHARAECSGGAA